MRRGVVITFASWLLFPAEVVVFGILHLIGCATILAISFVVLKTLAKITFVFGLMVIAISPLISYVWGPAFLIPLGIMPVGFASLDYDPLIPWFGVLLVGVALQISGASWEYAKSRGSGCIPWSPFGFDLSYP